MGYRRLQLLVWLAGFCLLSTMLVPPSGFAVQAQNSPSLSIPRFLQGASMTLPNPIFQHWTYSREEDQADIRTYRPKDYDFPPARGREGLEFRQNGVFIFYQIGATDASLAVSGRWSLQDSNVVEVQLPNQSYQLVILECDDQILRVRRK